MGFWDIFKKSLPVLGGAAAGALTGGALAPAGAAATGAALGAGTGAASSAAKEGIEASTKAGLDQAAMGATDLVKPVTPMSFKTEIPGPFDGLGQKLASQSAGTMVQTGLDSALNPPPEMPKPLRSLVMPQQTQRPRRGTQVYDQMTRGLG